MNRNIEERAMKLINSHTYVGVEDMVEITSLEAIDMETGAAYEGGLFDERAFGTSWRDIAHDYHGEEGWVPHFDKATASSMGHGGYIRLAVPLKWHAVTGRSADTNPLCLDVIGVLPPALRPIIQTEDGRVIEHPLNRLYARIIMMSNRIRALINAKAPTVILDNEQRMLTESVHTLMSAIYDLLEHTTDGAYFVVGKTLEVANVCNDVGELRTEVTARLDAHDTLLAEGRNEEARGKVLEALGILNKAHWRGVDITPLKVELMRAIEDNLTLNELLGIEIDECN